MWTTRHRPHKTGQIGGGTTFRKAILQCFLYQCSRFFPTQMFEHHHRGKDDGTWIYNIFSCNVGSRAVSSLKNGMPRLVVDVGARSDTDAAPMAASWSET